MKLNYRNQMILAVILIILANILTEILAHWIYRSAGFVICGLMWILHPVVPRGMEENRQTLFWTRIAGAILICIGLFTRVHY